MAIIDLTSKIRTKILFDRNSEIGPAEFLFDSGTPDTLDYNSKTATTVDVESEVYSNGNNGH